MSKQPTLPDTPNATSFAASPGGRMPSALPLGQQLDLFGPAHAHVNPFRSPDLAREAKMSGTSGPNLHGSSASADLQRSLASRLRQNLDANGSPEYVLTWSRWDMPSGPPICALRASGRRISGKGCSGWPTPRVNNPEKCNQSATGGPPQSLAITAQLAGWPTPCQQDGPKGGPNQGSDRLPTAVQMAGWPTPNAMEGGQTSRGGDRKGEPLMGGIIRGLQASSSHAPMEKPEGCRLNPLFSLWLQGFPPEEWASCAVRVMQSCRKSRRNL